MKNVTPLFCEDDTIMSWEYTLRKKSYMDQIPVHLGAWILATSKLHLLEVIFFYSLFHSNILFKTLSALDNHLSHMHYQLLYVDTGLVKSLELLSKYFY